MKPNLTQNKSVLSLFTLVRLYDSTVFRMVFPFLPALARGLGVPVETVAVAVSARSVPGLIGPPLGAIADMHGRKKALVWALIIFGFSMALVGFFPTYATFFIGMIISGGAIVIIDSSIHAYLGDKIPYIQRGKAMASVELGWSLAFVIGIPLVGWGMEHYGWSSPFIWLGVLGILLGGLVGLILPNQSRITGNWDELRFGLRQIIGKTPLLGLVLALLMTFGNQVISIVFGIWMENSFDLKVGQLGVASTVIGFAGIVGVGCAILFTDRLGKRKAVGLGIAVNSVICLVLPMVHSQLGFALATLFIFYLSFEFTITSLLPLMTTLSLQARGFFMAATQAALSLGDALGALVGPSLVQRGLVVNAACTLVINLCGLFILAAFIRPLNIDMPISDSLEKRNEPMEGDIPS